VLIDLAGSLGLSKQAAERVIETRAFKAAVDSDWARSLKVDPEYIPSLMLNGGLLVNPQTYDLFQGFMEKNRVRRRSASESYRLENFNEPSPSDGSG